VSSCEFVYGGVESREHIYSRREVAGGEFVYRGVENAYIAVSGHIYSGIIVMGLS
jgi:hypothetical protein